MAPMRSEFKIEPVKVAWQIENFDSFLFTSQPNSVIRSPEIIAYLPNPTKWCFKLYLKGENTVKICLKNKNDFKIRINYEIRPLLGEHRLNYRDVHTFRPDEEIGINHDILMSQERRSIDTNICRIYFTLGTPPHKSHFKIDNQLLSDIESLYRSHDIADFILRFDGEEFPLHLALLRVRAPKLENYFRNHFKANDFEEFLKAEGIAIDALEVYLRYIYCGHLWKIMAKKCKKFNTGCRYVIYEDANIGDLVCSSCSNILQQVYKMSIIFEMGNLKAELDPPGRYEMLVTSYLSVSRTFKWEVDFSELAACKSPTIYRKMDIQHIRLEMSVCMKMDKCNNKIFQFTLQLLPPVPEAETSLKFDIAVFGLERKIPPLEGRICLKPDTKLVRLPQTFLIKSIPKENEEQHLTFFIKLALPNDTKSHNRYARGSLNLPTSIYNYICFRENILSIRPTSDDNVVIHISNGTVQVSKFILCARSPVFRAMFSTSMIEGTTSTVNIPYIDFRTFNYFMIYVQYKQLPRKTNLKGKSFDLWLNLLQFADMYLVQSLVMECIIVLKRNLNIRNAYKVLDMAHFLNKADLLHSAMYFISDQF